jgi:uncharacterized protein (TIGR02145 family)
MKKFAALLSIFILLIACDEDKSITASPVLAFGEVKTYSDLPKCTDKLNDITYYVQKENTKYKCTDNKWQNEILVNTENIISSSSASESSSSHTGSSSGTSSSPNSSSSSSSATSSSSEQSSSSVYYTIALFGKCTTDREGERMRQKDSTKLNYLADFVCEPPYWRRMHAYDYSLDELHTSTAKYGTFTDERDGEVYKTVVIGNLEWMAENLRYKVPGDTMFEGGKNCYRNNPKYCKIGGYYYSYVDKPNACPKGWSLPGRGDVASLIENTTTESLRSQFGWYEGDTARVLENTNASGFKLLPENVIMAVEIYNTQEYLGYYSLPNTYMYAGASYSKNGRYEKAYHIRCLRGAPKSSSSAVQSSSSNAPASSSSKITSSSSSASPESSSSKVDLSSSSSVTHEISSSSEQESTSSSSADAEQSSSSAKASSSSSSETEETTSSSTADD